MIMQDKLEKERNDAKNNVEEYVYDMRDKLHGMFEKFISESVGTMLYRCLYINIYTMCKLGTDPSGIACGEILYTLLQSQS